MHLPYFLDARLMQILREAALIVSSVFTPSPTRRERLGRMAEMRKESTCDLASVI